ncbi:MAG TPA: transglutaminase domain-containing protein [Bacteroidales bacterium]|nr:transglutaminase domain-containing protein [Bacteroidales bacterium]
MKKILTISALLLISLSSCDTILNRHLIKGSDKRKEVHAQFEKRLKLVAGYDSSIFKTINSELTTKEREGFKFLYAYMPLSDLAMHSPEYVLKNVQLALKARKEFKWARKVPADIFLHFVLPYRVNNEYTDNAREVFFYELKERLIGLNAYQAALEVNYWCHEKVTYQSTDERTSGPLTAVLSAFGRCGEESTLAVAAYRSVGIPARQVYTPRWAHTDDNHAWVEVWVDGKWHFLGACEPEPELNRGWFAGPAKRTMMTRTIVFGKYDGAEEKLNQTRYFTEINLMSNYAPTRKLTVTVTDSTGQPVSGAKVEYQLYNYAEFYPIATLQTNEKGSCTLTTGNGDLMIWAQKDNTYAFTKADLNQNDIYLTLKKEIPFTNLSLTLTPPDEQTIPPYEEGKAEEHNRRIKQGNEIRENYISTFIDSASAANLAMEKGISIDETWKWLAKSRGNWNEVYTFIKNLDTKDITVGMAMLSTLRDKDLRDITADILYDHLSRVDSFPALLENRKVKEFDSYILSPRIGREFITTWRSYLQDVFTFEEIGFFRNNPQNIAQWIKEFVMLDTESNYYRVPLSPESVYRIRRADEYSMAIFFVAACRSFGIAARLEPTTKKPQYFMSGKWIDVDITESKEAQPLALASGMLTINLDKNSAVGQPKYYTHFTIARFEKGKYRTLNYEGSPTLSKLPATLELPEGLYRIVTGNRHKSGAVSCNIYHVKVEGGKRLQLTLTIPSTESEKKVLGSLSTSISLPVTGSPITIGQITKEKPAIIAIIDPLAEPSRHLLRDISSLSSEFADKGNGIALILAKGKSAKADLASIFDANPYPNTIALGNDINGEFEARVVQAVGKQQAYPIVFIVNNNGEIVYHSSGYSINLGEQLLLALKQ